MSDAKPRNKIVSIGSTERNHYVVLIDGDEVRETSAAFLTYEIAVTHARTAVEALNHCGVPAVIQLGGF